MNASARGAYQTSRKEPILLLVCLLSLIGMTLSGQRQGHIRVAAKGHELGLAPHNLHV